FAKEIIERFHGAEAAANAHKGAGNLIVEGEVPEGTPEVEVSMDGAEQFPIGAIINRAGLAMNGAQAKDMLKNGRVKVNWQVVEPSLMLGKGKYLIQAGKKKIAFVTLA
ncbi:MAG: tyrosine--tRNA ligase, partial [Gammaproteobacteria bacterium]|nr:tyrosine--tRNA ligase [Gammaproteobacteria bacterium]